MREGRSDVSHGASNQCHACDGCGHGGWRYSRRRSVLFFYMNAITARIRVKTTTHAPGNHPYLPVVRANGCTVDVEDIRTGDIVQFTPDEACRLAWKLLEAARAVDPYLPLRGKKVGRLIHLKGIIG